MLLLPMLQRLKLARHLDQALNVGMHDLMSFLGAERGNLQLFGRSQALLVVAQHGLTLRFLDAFRRVTTDSASVCGRAARERALVFVPDVADDPGFAPHLAVTREEGITSILSFPLITPAGDWIGMVSAHFAQRAHPSALEFTTVADYGRALAEALDRFLPTQARPDAVEAMAEALRNGHVVRAAEPPARVAMS